MIQVADALEHLRALDDPLPRFGVEAVVAEACAAVAPRGGAGGNAGGKDGGNAGGKDGTEGGRDGGGPARGGGGGAGGREVWGWVEVPSYTTSPGPGHELLRVLGGGVPLRSGAMEQVRCVACVPCCVLAKGEAARVVQCICMYTYRNICTFMFL